MIPPLLITRVEAAEGETDPPTVVVRRIDGRASMPQVVSAVSRDNHTRPIVAVVADIADATSANINIPVTDKSQRLGGLPSEY